MQIPLFERGPSPAQLAKEAREAEAKRKQAEESILKFFQDVDQACRYTPDGWFVSQFQNWNVFVYGAEKRRMPKHRKIFNLDAEYECTAFTCVKFTSWVYQIGNESFPIALDCDEKDEAIPEVTEGEFNSIARPHAILGELFKIPSERIYELDEHMLNSVMFRRRRTTVMVRYRHRFSSEAGVTHSPPHWQIVPCYMYIGVPEFWNQVIDNGYLTKPTKVFKPNDDNLPIHSHFTRLDINDERDYRETRSM